MPPNYDKPTYRELGILGNTKGVKNPINYTIREAMRAKGRASNFSKKQPSNEKSGAREEMRKNKTQSQ